MKTASGKFIYLTYTIYNRLNSFNESIKTLKEIKDRYFYIYEENKEKCIIKKRFDEGWWIEEHLYKEYKLIYFVDETNIFLVNVLEKEVVYQVNTEIAFKNFEEIDIYYWILLHGVKYRCLNVGKAFIEFNKYNSNRLLKKDMNMEFWSTFQDYINGKVSNHFFGYRKFTDVIIVYTYSKKNL